METLHPPHQATNLAAPLYFQVVNTLTDLLPPPLDASPEALHARNHAAIAKVAALLPVNASEIDLAAQCIAARAQAEDLLRLLRQHAGDVGLTMRLNAQYALMVRTSLSVHARLMKLQALRHKREAIEGAANQDAWTQHVAEQSMLAVVDPDPGPLQAPSPERARTPSPERARTPSPERAWTPSPEEARTISPERAPPAPAEAAPVATLPTCPDGAPAALADQEIRERVLADEIYSHYAAFETWVSGHQGATQPEKTGLRIISEAIAKSRLAGPQSPATVTKVP